MAIPASCNILRNPGPILAGIGAILLGSAPPARGSTIDWALHARPCSQGASTIEVPCGDYGVFHFIDIQVPSGCTPLAEGSEDPPPYIHPGNLDVFPVAPHLLPHGMQPAPPPQPSGTMTVPQLPGSSAPWMAVLDFEGPHGASTTWLVGAVAGPDVQALLTILDDPALAELGAVGDFHVLAKLCDIAEKVDFGGVDSPRAVNMSFGRSLTDGDDEPHTSCDGQRGSCQIARVIQQLRERGTSFVAAAGNHQELLFPAALPNVLAVGMLDVTSFFEGVTQPAWESPTTAKGLFPGNALCLRDWAAPSGSSYSSAMLTGWLSKVIERSPNLNVLAGGMWTPRLHPALGCYVLALGARMAPWCNDEIDVLFEGLLGANDDECWSIATTPSVELQDPGDPQSQPALPSLSAWMAETHATPESDPCVPCVGQLVGAGASSDLVIDFSQSSPLPGGVHLDSVFLRVGGAFYLLPLQSTQIDSIENGTLAELVLAGWGSLVSPAQHPSLLHQLKNDPLGDCSLAGTCFWSSTPILLKH